LALAAAVIALAPLVQAPPLAAAGYTDDLGRTVSFSGTPKRTVSLVPGATEILCSIGAGAAVAAVTLDDNYFECIAAKPRVGAREAPDWNLVKSFRPDLVIAGPDMLATAEAALAGTGARILAYGDPDDLAGSEARVAALGELFGKRSQAAAALADGRDYLETVSRKAAKLPGDRKRIMRLRALPGGGLGSGGPGTPDSAIIEAAGGIPWPGGTPGEISPVSGEEFARFDPQFVYACFDDREAVEAARKSSPWRRASAFKGDQNVMYYACALTDRLSSHAGYFAAWLSGDAYADEYGDPANLALNPGIIGETPISVPGIPYVKGARMIEYRLFDFIHRTVLVEFDSPQTVVTTDAGPAHGVTAIGNNYAPPMMWNIHHRGGWQESEKEVFGILGLDPARTTMIYTGADMRNLSVKTARYRDLTVTALVTGGAETNALRASRDPGDWYLPGTINVMVLSSRRLSPAGAAKLVIVATEAKTAALWDLDVRSSASPLANPATGTGTDDVIVPAAGDGSPVDWTGGHTKIGELAARVVYDAVTEALLKQNATAPGRSVWERLAERGIGLSRLSSAYSGRGAYPGLALEVKALMTDPAARSLMEAAFSLSDAQVMGHVEDASPFEAMALQAATRIAGRPVTAVRSLVEDKDLPPVLKAALDALGTAVLARDGR
jgi:adenosylcobinamide amidohydrolase/ABC-type Fe3+-hydroxamate transport system substrate-binding protein